MVGNNQYVLSDKHVYLLIRTGLKCFSPHCSVSLMIANGYASGCLLKRLHTGAFSLSHFTLYGQRTFPMKMEINLGKC